MKHFLSALLFLGCVAIANSAAATTYVYSGPNYTSASGVYTTAMTITGNFTTAAPLPANLANAPIGPGGANLVTSWSFFDGVNTLTSANSGLFSGAPTNFAVSTNAAGQITTFNIIVATAPPNTVGQLMNGIAIFSNNLWQSVISDGGCTTLSGNVCTVINAGSPANLANSSGAAVPGAFAISAPAMPAPMLNLSLLALLALALLALAGIARARQQRV